jgi:hypothetical protein
MDVFTGVIANGGEAAEVPAEFQRALSEDRRGVGF